MDDTIKNTVKNTASNDMTGEDYKKLCRSMLGILGEMVALRTPENKYHVDKIQYFTNIIANKVAQLYPDYGLTPEKIEDIVLASCVHDIGNMGIPDSILGKTGRLSDEEFEVIKSHPLRGLDIIEKVGAKWRPEFDAVLKQVVRSHHERYSGGGYPDGLKGEAIPIAAQIVSLADMYSSLTSDRVHRRAFSKERAYSIITEDNFEAFSPKMLEVLSESKDEIEKYLDAHPEN